MNIWLGILLSSIGASLLGSLILWVMLGVFPGSTAGFTISLYVSMVMLSSIVISISTLILTFCFTPHVQRLSSHSTLSTSVSLAIAGAVVYFLINLCIMMVSNNKGIAGQFFSSGVFLFPILVGAIYGASFGWVFSRLRF